MTNNELPHMPNHYRYEADFFTATNLNWKRLLKPAKYKDIIVNSLRYLSEDNKVAVHGFVIMDNHLHLIWHIRPHWRESEALASCVGRLGPCTRHESPSTS